MPQQTQLLFGGAGYQGLGHAEQELYYLLQQKVEGGKIVQNRDKKGNKGVTKQDLGTCTGREVIGEVRQRSMLGSQRRHPIFYSPSLGKVGPIGHNNSAEHNVILGEVAGEKVSGTYHRDTKDVGHFIPMSCI